MFVTDGAPDGVDLAAKAAFHAVPVELAIGGVVADDGFDGTYAQELLLDLPVAMLVGAELGPLRLL